MIRRVELALLFVCVVSFRIPAGAQTPPQAPMRLTLEEAQRVALQNHPTIRVAQYAASAAKEVTTQVRSAYFPTAYASLTGVEADKGSRISTGGLNNPLILNRFASGLTVGQLVTDFGRTRNLVASAKLGAQAAQEGVVLSRADVLLGVDRAFYGALRAQAVLRVAEETVKERQLVADQITALAKSKLKSGLDVSFANVNLQEARLLLLKAQNDTQASAATLSEALGFADQRQFELTEPSGALPLLPQLADSISAADRDRPELIAQRFTLDSAKHLATAERDLWLPTIALAGVAGEAPYRQLPLPDAYAAAGFNVNIPIFNGRLFNARRAEAEDRARAAAESLRNLEVQVARDVRVAWLAANTAYQNLAVTAQLLDQANLALDLAQARYNLGLGSIVELSQAQLNQAQASIEEASAKYDYGTRLAELTYQEGSLR